MECTVFNLGTVQPSFGEEGCALCSFLKQYIMEFHISKGPHILGSSYSPSLQALVFWAQKAHQQLLVQNSVPTQAYMQALA